MFLKTGISGTESIWIYAIIYSNTEYWEWRIYKWNPKRKNPETLLRT